MPKWFLYLYVKDLIIEEEKEEVELEVGKTPDQIYTSQTDEHHVCSRWGTTVSAEIAEKPQSVAVRWNEAYRHILELKHCINPWEN